MKSMMLTFLALVACTGCATGRAQQEIAVTAKADVPDVVRIDRAPTGVTVTAEYRVTIVH